MFLYIPRVQNGWGSFVVEVSGRRVDYLYYNKWLRYNFCTQQEVLLGLSFYGSLCVES